MRSLWKPSDKTIGGIRCIELRTIAFGHENVAYCLASKKGEIWEHSRGAYRAVLKCEKRSYKRLGERLIAFGEDKLQEVIAELEIPLDPKNQTPWANGFSK